MNTYKDRDEHGRFLPGHSQSKETNRKIGEKHRNRVLSDEWKKKISMTKTGIRRINARPCKNCKKMFIPKRRNNVVYCTISCSRIGKPSWNKGTKGRVKANSGTFKKGDTRVSGANNNNWRGGITPINKAVRNSLEYKLWRKAVYERDDYTCVLCGAKGSGKNLNADHIKPFAYFLELRLEVSNGRTLCVACHKQTDTFSGRVNISSRERDIYGRFI